ncbi:MAG: hypothetical protein JSR82_23455 [Verrucomicrobia bacterium]|nr:hypothetical protein [Verrucomicrobiota bacterium]
MPRALRLTLAALAGFFTAFLLVSLFERLGHSILPPPKDLDFRTVEAARASMSKLSAGNFALIFLAHAMGALGGPIVAGLIAPGRAGLWALLIGGLVFAASTANFILLHVPVLPGTIDLLCVAAAAYLAYLYLRARPEPAT